MHLKTNTPIRMAPITPAIATPMIKEVSGLLLEEVVEIEAVEVGTFPTVDSRRFTDSDACMRLNVSAVTTSKYAHPGTAINELINFGYLSSDV